MLFRIALFLVVGLAACHSKHHDARDASTSMDSSASPPDLAGTDGAQPPHVDGGADGMTGPIDLGTINHCDPSQDCPDLVINQSLLGTSVVIETREFAQPVSATQNTPHVGSDCSVAEGSVGASGVRRLLRFSTGATNIGKGDFLLGNPTDPKNMGFFQYAPCHGHYHFSGFANYKLLNSDGTTALNGHKQAFCIEDNTYSATVDPYGGVSSPNPPTNCESPGLHRGWSDVYTNHTEANWIDITGLAAGTYTLVVTLNDERVIVESDYTNNQATTMVTIADDAHPEICPADTEALLRCVGETEPGTAGDDMTRCYQGVRNTYACVTADTCTQPTEISHQAHCGSGGTGTTGTTCASGTTAKTCTTETDPLSGAAKSVMTFCSGGVVYTEYCGTQCVTSGSGATCQ